MDSFPFSNADASAVFDEIADLLEVQGGSGFRVRAYRNASRLMTSLSRNVAEMLAAGEQLEGLHGIGKDLAARIAEIVGSGSCALLEELRSQIDPGVRELLRLPGIGPRRVQVLYRELGIHSLAQLRSAAEQGRVRSLRGFSKFSEERLLESVRGRTAGRPAAHRAKEPA